uniref:Uncharacterized protein n=1 Tax=Panagrolaimus sp. ES5 TaxID=591445 RepID=A0AC34FTB8_9BILA
MKKDSESSLDKFQDLYRKLFIELKKFCNPRVECINGLILFLSFENRLLKSYDEIYQACKYLNENAIRKIVFDDSLEITEEQILINLADKELMLYSIISLVHQTYKVSIDFSDLKDSFEYFSHHFCLIDKEYFHGPNSVNVPSFRTIRKTFEDYYPVYESKSAVERIIRIYKVIEKENKNECKAAVYGLLLFFSWYNGLLNCYDDIYKVAFALTKCTQSHKNIEFQNDVHGDGGVDINKIFGDIHRALYGQDVTITNKIYKQEIEDERSHN